MLTQELRNKLLYKPFIEMFLFASPNNKVYKIV